jgi:predicted ester cyclase
MSYRKFGWLALGLLVSLIVIVGASAQEATSEALEATAEATGFSPATIVVSGDVSEDTAQIIQAYGDGYREGFLQGKFTAEAQYQDPLDDEPTVGSDAIEQQLNDFFTNTFTDISITPTTATITGNRVIVEFLFQGRNVGSFLGQPPANVVVSIPMVAIYEVEGEQVTNARVYYDTRSILVQLGYLTLDGMRSPGTEATTEPGTETTPEATPAS